MPSLTTYQRFYDIFSAAAGCPVSKALANDTSLACLRSAPMWTIYNATAIALAQPGGQAFGRAEDGYFHDRLPSDSVRLGRVAPVPVIIGTV